MHRVSSSSELLEEDFSYDHTGSTPSETERAASIVGSFEDLLVPLLLSKQVDTLVILSLNLAPSRVLESGENI